MIDDRTHPCKHVVEYGQLSKTLAQFRLVEDEARGMLGHLSRLGGLYSAGCNGNTSLANQGRNIYDKREGYLKTRTHNRVLLLFVPF